MKRAVISFLILLMIIGSAFADSSMMVHYGDEYILVDPYNHFINLGNGIQEYEVLFEENRFLNEIMNKYNYFYLTDIEYDIIYSDIVDKEERKAAKVISKASAAVGNCEYVYGYWQDVRIEIDGEMKELTFIIATCDRLVEAYEKMGYDDRSIMDLAYKLIVLR